MNKTAIHGKKWSRSTLSVKIIFFISVLFICAACFGTDAFAATKGKPVIGKGYDKDIKTATYGGEDKNAITGIIRTTDESEIEWHGAGKSIWILSNNKRDNCSTILPKASQSGNVYCWITNCGYVYSNGQELPIDIKATFSWKNFKAGGKADIRPYIGVSIDGGRIHFSFINHAYNVHFELFKHANKTSRRGKTPVSLNTYVTLGDIDFYQYFGMKLPSNATYYATSYAQHIYTLKDDGYRWFYSDEHATADGIDGEVYAYVQNLSSFDLVFGTQWDLSGKYFLNEYANDNEHFSKWQESILARTKEFIEVFEDSKEGDQYNQSDFKHSFGWGYFTSYSYGYTMPTITKYESLTTSDDDYTEMTLPHFTGSCNYYYTLYLTIPDVRKEMYDKYKSLTITDNLVANCSYVSLKNVIKMSEFDDKHSRQDVTNWFTNQSTSGTFSLKVKPDKVTQETFYNEVYKIQFEVKADKVKTLSILPEQDSPGVFFMTWTNIASVSMNGKYNESNEVSTHYYPASASVTVTKKDETSGNPLTGATFTVYRWSNKAGGYIQGTSSYNDQNNHVMETTQKDNPAYAAESPAGSGIYKAGLYYETPDNPEGKFKLVETAPPKMHTKSKDVYFGYGVGNINRTYNKYRHVTNGEYIENPVYVNWEQEAVADDPYAPVPVTLVKKDPEDGSSLTGATFYVEPYDTANARFDSSKRVKLLDNGNGTYSINVTANNDGTYTVVNGDGTYTIKGEELAEDGGNYGTYKGQVTFVQPNRFNNGRFRIIETASPKNYKYDAKGDESYSKLQQWVNTYYRIETDSNGNEYAVVDEFTISDTVNGSVTKYDSGTKYNIEIMTPGELKIRKTASDTGEVLSDGIFKVYSLDAKSTKAKNGNASSVSAVLGSSTMEEADKAGKLVWQAEAADTLYYDSATKTMRSHKDALHRYDKEKNGTGNVDNRYYMGSARMENDGYYKVVEETPPVGYTNLTEDGEKWSKIIEIKKKDDHESIASENIFSLNLTNAPNHVYLEKRNYNSKNENGYGDPLNGVKFQFGSTYAEAESSGHTYTTGNVVKYTKTVSGGMVTLVKDSAATGGTIDFRALAPGTYVYREIETLPGYKLENDWRTFTIDDQGLITGNGADQNITVTFTAVNMHGQRIDITKLSSKGSTAETATDASKYTKDAGKDVLWDNNTWDGTTFEIHEWSSAANAFKETAYGRITWDADKKAFVTTRPDGWVTWNANKQLFESALPGEYIHLIYTTDNEGKFEIRETHATEGFTIDEEAKIITITERPENGDDILKAASFTDTPNAFTLTKIDSEEKAVPGCTFDFYRDEDADNGFSLTTDDNGNITVTRLPHGTWHYQETSAPVGYQMDDTEYTLVVDDTGLIDGTAEKEGSVTNVKSNMVKIIKGDESIKSDASENQYGENEFPNGTEFDVYEYDAETGEYSDRSSGHITYHEDDDDES